MKLLTAIESIEKLRDESRRAGKALGLVPTMGALHEGHESLVRRARAECEIVIASVFVNPLQFAAGEDFEQYPRDLEGDRKRLEACGCDVLFTTSPSAMYPSGFRTFVVPEGPIASRFEAEIRPGHFRGVATVVLKLFLLSGAQHAYFGRKDAQQAAVVARMIADLNVPTRLTVCPTVRAADGLALSSRNAYLSADERRVAPRIFHALSAARERVKSGELGAPTIRTSLEADLRSIPGGRIDYAELVDPSTFESIGETIPRRVGRIAPVLAVTAVRLGKTRLLDNLRLDEDGP